ncbi:MAG: CaiB/BaiF CoA-transferase family protein [Cyclobacteriaceae bacterium]
MNLPLKDIIVLEFCQYLSGPSAGLRLADLGARVIKIESPRGDACRKLAIENLWADENDSLLFHTINRNKESLIANLKDPEEVAQIKKLIAKADVMIHNFRPGVMEKLGLDYDSVRAINEGIVFADVSGYGSEGPWSKKPGQDLLLQAKSGLMFTSGNHDDPPVPFGLAIGDILCGAQLVQGILAALIRKEKTGKGAKLEVSLLESLLDFQFELLTTYYASGKMPERSKTSNGHSLLGAPYGLHQTSDGYIAIAMMPLQDLAEAIDCAALLDCAADDVFAKRDEIKSVLAEHLKGGTSKYWLDKLRANDLWVMELTDWKTLNASDGCKELKMEQHLTNGKFATKCPIRINRQDLRSDRPAPRLGADTADITKEFGLN